VSFTCITKDMQIISAELQRIASELDMLYVRALNTNDLNQKLQRVPVDKPLLVYANLNPVEFPETGSNFEFYEVEANLYILDLSKTADPTAEEIDAQLDPLFDLGNFIYDALTRSPIIFPAMDIERGTMTPAEQIEQTDEVLNGWEMALTLPIKRNSYYCGN
jgi:hypothetical protein